MNLSSQLSDQIRSDAHGCNVCSEVGLYCQCSFYRHITAVEEALQLTEDKSSIFRGFSEEENILDEKISESTEMKQNI